MTFPTPDRSEYPASPQIAAALQPFVDAGSLAGAVTLVADRDGVVAITAVGWADIEAGRPMRADTVVWIASQTKPITATALMILADAGKVKVTDPVAEYLPEFAGQWLAVESDDDHILLKKPKRPIIVRDVVSHVSGMGYATPIELPALDRLPLRTAVGSHAMTPLATEPGTKYAYSNGGINTAGRLVEVLSGMPYEAFLNERLLGPLGMVDTTFFPTQAQEARVARSYRPNANKTALEAFDIEQLTYPLSGPGRYPMPAGGLFSTAADIARFCRMFLRGGELDGRRYLKEETVAEMTRRQTPADIPESCGLGWHQGEGFYGHGGAHSTGMSIWAPRGMITSWLPQHAGFLGNGDQAGAAFEAVALGR